MSRRNADYKLLKAVQAFEPTDQDAVGTCGNIQSLFNPTFDANPATGKWENVGGIFKGKCFYERVSAPMLLAKLVASFPGLSVKVYGQEAYKVTWDVVLKHKETGALLTFYDWKGAASFGSNLMPKEAPEGFARDAKALLLALASKRFPHPYDGCVIGEIA